MFERIIQIWKEIFKKNKQHQSTSSAPIAPGGRTILALFVKKRVNLLSVACQLLKEKVHVALFQVSMIHPKKYYSRIR